MDDKPYYLSDGQLLQRLMKCPQPGGTRHTVRSLATLTKVGKSKLSNAINGRQTRFTAEDADTIAAAVGVQRSPLFLPRTFVIANANIEQTEQEENR